LFKKVLNVVIALPVLDDKEVPNFNDNCELLTDLINTFYEFQHCFSCFDDRSLN